jgi:hypothetical protein
MTGLIKLTMDQQEAETLLQLLTKDNLNAAEKRELTGLAARLEASLITK